MHWWGSGSYDETLRPWWVVRPQPMPIIHEATEEDGGNSEGVDAPAVYSPLLLRDDRALALELERPQVTAETIAATSVEAEHSERDQAQHLEEAIKAFVDSSDNDDDIDSSSNS